MIEFLGMFGTTATVWASYTGFMCWLTGDEDSYYCKNYDTLVAGPYQIRIG